MLTEERTNIAIANSTNSPIIEASQNNSTTLPDDSDAILTEPKLLHTPLLDQTMSEAYPEIKEQYLYGYTENIECPANQQDIRDEKIETPEAKIAKLPDISPDIKNLILKYKKIICPEQTIPFGIPDSCFHIDLTSDVPVYIPMRKVPYAMRSLYYKLLQKYLRLGIIQRAESCSYSMPIHLVKKGKDSIRMTYDLRALNLITVKQHYALPRISDLVMRLKGARYFTSLDISEAFYQVLCSKQTTQILSFQTPWGSYRCCRMAMGAKNASEYFQATIDRLLADIPNVVSYIDDLIIHTTTLEEHYIILDKVFSILYDNNVLINIKKCTFLCQELTFLGHTISVQGIKPLRSKIDAIDTFQLPQTHTQLRSYLGLYNYERIFFRQIAECLNPLYQMIDSKKKKEKLKWTDQTRRAFEQSKAKLKEAIAIAYCKPNEPMHLYADASDHSLGAVLTQKYDIEGKSYDRILGVYSKPLSNHEQHCSIHLKELLSLREAVRFFYYYVYHNDLHLYTDNASVYNLCVTAPESVGPRKFRIIEELMQYSPQFHLLTTLQNHLADAFSRARSQEAITTNQDRPTHKSELIGLIHSEIQLENLPGITPDDTLKDLADDQINDQELQNIFQELNYSMESASKEPFLILRKLKGLNKHLYGEFSRGYFRPYITKPFRLHFFLRIHSPAHPGIQRSIALIQEHVYWKTLPDDIAALVRSCETCAKNKIYRHERSRILHFRYDGVKLSTVHSDVLGPLNPIDGYKYVVVFIDRATRMFAAAPMRNNSADELIYGYLYHWIAVYGVNKYLISDNGGNYRSAKLRDLNKALGVQHIFIDAWSPQQNGISERLIKTLKEALRCHSNPNNWLINLPIVSLFLKNLMGTDGISASQVLMGHQLPLPALAFSQDNITFSTTQARDMLRFFRACPPREFRNPPNRTIYRNPELNRATHVFLRFGQRRTSLQTRYEGPFPLLKISEKSAIISKNGYIHKVSRDRLKMAHLMPIRFIDETSLFKDLIPINLGENVTDETTENDPDITNPTQEPLRITNSHNNSLAEYYRETLPFQDSELPDQESEDNDPTYIPHERNKNLFQDPRPSTSGDHTYSIPIRPKRTKKKSSRYFSNDYITY